MIANQNLCTCRRAAEGIRTLDLVLTKDALYQLSYSSHLRPCNRQRAAEGIRTLDLVLTKDALYQLSYSSPSTPQRVRARRLHRRPSQSLPHSPAHSHRTTARHCADSPRKAGEGNRTLVFSLEGYGSTIELHPQADHRLATRAADFRTDARLCDSPPALPLADCIRCHLLYRRHCRSNGGCRIRTCEGIAIRFTV